MRAPEVEIKRLVKMLGTDEGFYVLATQAFMEGYMGDHYPGFQAGFGARFKDNLFGFKRHLIEEAAGQWVPGVDSFDNIRRQRKLTDEVRHAFRGAHQSDAAAATTNLCEFAKAVKLSCPELDELNASLDVWRNRSTPAQMMGELEQMRRQLSRQKAQGAELQEKLTAYQAAQETLEQQNLQVAQREAEINRLQQSSENRKARIDELRRERNQWSLERRETQQRLAGMEAQKEYLRNILHLSLYARTRMDYERSLRQLTVEQKAVLETITLKSDFLIKGGAGTGKTLVLLEALRKVNSGKLGLDEKRVLLLTYTRTLVRYDQYLSELMNLSASSGGIDVPRGEKSPIQTADSYLNGLIQGLLGLRVDYHLLKNILSAGKAEKRAGGALKRGQLQRELQDFIYAGGISREEYIDQMISRRGLKVPLNRRQREEVWALKEELEETMLGEGRGAVCRGLSRVKLAQRLLREASVSEDRLDQVLPDRPDYIFIDEAQDLTSLELRILKIIARENLIMAGDRDQTIYGLQSPYRRAGIDLQGCTRILRHNYRNTLPIHALAEGFRQNRGSDQEINPTAFRDGPPPELYTSDTTEALYDLLAERVKIFTELLDYDPENLCILAPDSRFLNKIAERLEAAGFRTVGIGDDDFTFAHSGALRLATLHASKGLDLPVTLLFLPTLYSPSGFSEEAALKQQRNLLYVAMTRAMEHLNVFTKTQGGGAVLEDLRSLFAEKRARV